MAARKKAGLTQKEVASRLQREDGRVVLPPDPRLIGSTIGGIRLRIRSLNKLARILNISADVLYFHAKRLPGDVERDADDNQVEEAYRAFRKVLQKGREKAPTKKN